MSGRIKSNRTRSEKLNSTNKVENLLNILLALDRTIVELSMLTYDIPPRYKSAMRKQNRHFHDAIKTHVPFFADRALISKS